MAIPRAWTRIYEAFPLVSPHCGAPMRIIAFVTDTVSVTRMLRHLGEPIQPPPVSPARGPPQWEEESFNQRPVYDPPQGEPDLGFEFNQTGNW